MSGAGPDTNPSARGSSRRRPLVLAAFAVGVFGAFVTGAYVLLGALMTAAAFVARGRQKKAGR
jgi:hypothetical protein